MAVFSQSRNCCFMIPIKTGVFLITVFGLLNKLSGFYGIISLDYSDPIVICIHIYSLLALGIFVAGLYGVSKGKYNIVHYYTLFYWFDMFVCTVTSIYLAVQWFAYTDHSLPELSNDPKGKLQHDEAFRIESVVSIVCLCIIRVIHFYFAYVITCYYVSIGKTQYSKLTAAVDEELNFTGYNNEDTIFSTHNNNNGSRRRSQ